MSKPIEIFGWDDVTPELSVSGAWLIRQSWLHHAVHGPGDGEIDSINILAFAATPKDPQQIRLFQERVVILRVLGKDVAQVPLVMATPWFVLPQPCSLDEEQDSDSAVQLIYEAPAPWQWGLRYEMVRK